MRLLPKLLRTLCGLRPISGHRTRFIEQRTGVHAEERSESLQCLKSEVPLPPLDRTEVGPVDAHAVRERLLAVALRKPVATQIAPHDSLQLAFHVTGYASGALLERSTGL